MKKKIKQFEWNLPFYSKLIFVFFDLRYLVSCSRFPSPSVCTSHVVRVVRECVMFINKKSWNYHSHNLVEARKNEKTKTSDGKWLIDELKKHMSALCLSLLPTWMTLAETESLFLYLLDPCVEIGREDTKWLELPIFYETNAELVGEKVVPLRLNFYHWIVAWLYFIADLNDEELNECMRRIGYIND